MSADRIAVLENRLAAVEQAVAELRVAERPSDRTPFVSSNPNDPLDGHPLIWTKPAPDVLDELQARVNRELGIAGMTAVGPDKLREMMLADGVDPNGNEFSRGIVEMREE